MKKVNFKKRQTRKQVTDHREYARNKFRPKRFGLSNIGSKRQRFVKHPFVKLQRKSSQSKGSRQTVKPVISISEGPKNNPNFPLVFGNRPVAWQRRCMVKGGKSQARSLIKDTIRDLVSNWNRVPQDVFASGEGNMMPSAELRKIRRGRGFIEVPFPLRQKRQGAKARTALLKVSRSAKRSSSVGNNQAESWSKSFSVEMLKAADNTGFVVQEKHNIERTAARNAKDWLRRRWNN
jgi:ribosomal protein S7